MATRSDIATHRKGKSDDIPTDDELRAHDIEKIEQLTSDIARGVSYTEVARAYDMDPDEVVEAIMLYNSLGRARLNREAYAVLVDMRLDLLRQAMWPRAMRGKASAVQQILRIESLGMKLHGLDMGTQAARDQAAALQLAAETQSKALALATARALEDVGLPYDIRMKVLDALSNTTEQIAAGVDYYDADLYEAEPQSSSYTPSNEVSVYDAEVIESR